MAGQLNPRLAAQVLCEVCGGLLREAADKPDYWANKKVVGDLKQGASEVLNQIEDVVILRLKQDKIDPENPMENVAAAVMEQQTAMRAVYDAAYQATAPIGYERAAVEWKLGVRLDQVNEWAQQWLQQYSFEASDATMARVTGDIAGLIRQANTAGLSIPNTVDLLRQGFDGMKTWQLDRIAVTELHTANQAGVHLSFLDAKVEYNMWISQVGSDRTRRRPRDKADHVVLNGEVVRVGEKFSNGLVFPGDKSGPIVEWIRCRCRKRPWIPPAGWAPRATPFKA